MSILAEEIPQPNAEVNDITKDSIGRIWLATSEGVQLFDGFESIRLTSLPQKKYKYIQYVNSNHVWVFGEKEVWSVNCSNLNAKRIFNISRQPAHIGAVSSNRATSALVFGLSNGAIYRILRNEKIKLEVKGTDRIQTLTEDGHGTIYFSQGIYVYRSAAGKTTRIWKDKTQTPFKGIWYLGGKLHVGTWFSGLAILENSAVTDVPPVKITYLNKSVIEYTLADSSLHVASSKNASLRYDALYHFIKGNNTVFLGKTVRCIAPDQSTIWIGTNKGLIKLSKFKSRFTKMLDNHLPLVSTRTIIKEGNKIYVTSYSGIFYKNGKEEWINISQQNEKFKDVAPETMISAGSVFYMAMHSPSIYRLQKGQNRIERTDFITFRKGFWRGFFCMIPSPGPNLWLGGSMGIVALDTTTGKVMQYAKGLFDVKRHTVRHLFYDSTRRYLYAATTGGLFIFHEDGRLLKTITSQNTQGLQSDSLNYVARGPDGKLWLGANDGLYLLGENTILKHLDKDDGLSDNLVYGFLFDRYNRLWISTNNGLSSYNTKNNTFRNYYTIDGLSSNEFNRNSFMQDEQGILYFGGINGVNSFNPSEIEDAPSSFRIYLSGIKKWNKRGSQVLPYTPRLKMTRSSSDYSMSVMFGVSDYTEQQKTTFLYRIEDITPAWTPIPDFSNTFMAEGLPYGKYNIEVKAVNFRGTASSNIIRFQLTLLAPVYYRWWFIAAALAVAAAVFYLIGRYRMQQVKKYQDLRVKIASDLHDEVGGLLTGIGMYSDNLATRSDINNHAQERVGKIAALSRQAISSMRDILWSIDARNDRIGALEEQVRSVAEEILIPLDIRLDILFENNSGKKTLPGDMRQQLYFIAKEAINNIAKHSKADQARIVLIYNGNSFMFSVSGNGVKEFKPRSGSQGLKNMEMRAAYLKAKFQYTLREGFFSIIISKNYPHM